MLNTLIKNKNRNIRFGLGEQGQALFETILSLPLLLLLLGLFLLFIYERLCTVIIENVLHEAQECEETLIENTPSNYCILNAIQKIEDSKILIKHTRIYKYSNSYYAEFNLIGGLNWKTIHVKNTHLE